MVERSGEASFLQAAEEIWLQSETEVQREGGRCREDGGDWEIEARGGRGGLHKLVEEFICAR